MKVLPDDFIAELLSGGLAERRHLELKPAFAWTAQKDLWVRETVIRTILGMTNTPTGGVIVIGVDATDKVNPVLTGVSPDPMETFEDFEAIKGTVDSFATLATTIAVGKGVFSGKDLILVTVSEFDRRPVLCKKNGSGKSVLRERELYVRPQRGEPRTEKMSEVELEELIGLAMAKETNLRRSQGWVPEEPQDVAKEYANIIKDLA